MLFLDGETGPMSDCCERESGTGGGRLDRFPGRCAASPPATGVVALDFNYDFKTDLVLAGAGGVRLFKQEQQRRFMQMSQHRPAFLVPLPAPATQGGWAADYEMDGDLDIVLAPVDGQPLVLRNNGDGTFKEVRPFEGVYSGSRLCLGRPGRRRRSRRDIAGCAGRALVFRQRARRSVSCCDPRRRA